MYRNGISGVKDHLGCRMQNWERVYTPAKAGNTDAAQTSCVSAYDDKINSKWYCLFSWYEIH